MQHLTTLCSVFLSICLLVGIGACTPDPFPPVPKKERTFVHVLNVYGGTGGVDLQITNYNQAQTVANNLRFQEAWPSSGYADLLITPGADSLATISELTLDILDHQSQEALVPERSLQFPGGTYSTICLIDSFGKPMVVRTADRLKEAQGTESLVRFMNLSPNALSVSLEFKTDTMMIERLTFLNYSGFKSAQSGSQTVYFVNDFTHSIIDSLTNVRFLPRHSYSFYLVNHNGVPVAGYEILDQE